MYTHPYYFFKNVFDRDECELIIDTTLKNSDKGAIDRHAEGKDVDVLLIHLPDFLGEIFDKISMKIRQANLKCFGYDLYEHYEYPLLSNLNFYSAGKEYPYHIDAEPLGSKSDTKLTMICNLSTEDYEGGKFYLKSNKYDTHISELDTMGNMIIFPSFILHKVEPVTKGKRITLSHWFCGPAFK